jgi:hypothetical protein
LTTEGDVSWTFAPEFDAASRAALSTGKPLLYVAPPAAWALRPLLEQLPEHTSPGLRTVILVPERLSALDLHAEITAVPALGPARIATGIDHTTRLLREQRVRTLVATPAMATGLAGRSAIDPTQVAHVFVCWPEVHFALDRAADLEAILAELRTSARIIVTGDPGPITDFVARYAHRAPAVMAAPVPANRLPAVRTGIAASTALAGMLEAAIDELRPTSTVVWDPSEARHRRWEGRDPGVPVGADIETGPVDLAVAADLPSAEALTALQQSAERVLVLLRPYQLAYAQHLVKSMSAMSLTGEVRRARDWREELQEAVRKRITAESLNEHLLALSPLFEEFDPALVAAALVDVAGTAGTATAPTPDIALWAHIRLEAGRRDQLRPGDVVGALLNAVGLPKDHIGRVDLRDTFSLVEVRAESAEKAVRGLTGINLKGRAVAARFDRR